MKPDHLPNNSGAFGSQPTRVQVGELRRAGERDRAEARAAAERAKAKPTAVAARRPGLRRPGGRQLHRANFLAAATNGISDPETARAALAAIRQISTEET